MTRTRATAPVAVVIVGEFGDGPDAMLWNPHLSRARWRRASVRAALPATVVLGGLAGAGLVAWGWGCAYGFAAALAIGIGVFVLADAVFVAWVHLDSFTFDHVHPRGRRCRIEHHPGEYFYRCQDFADLGPDVHATVTGLVEAVAHLHGTPSRAWLDPDLPGQAHRVVWEALSCLDRTRTGRVLAKQLRADPDAGELAAAVEEAVAVTDRALGEVATRLQDCVALTLAWETKLRHTDLRARTEDTLAALREIGASRLVAAAEPLPQTVFANLTAARDVTGAGSFPWEHHPGPAPSAAIAPRPVATGQCASGSTDLAGDAADRTTR